MLNRRQTFTLTVLALACMATTAQTLFSPTVGEYNWSTSVVQLGMRNVHGRGILGQGVVIALLDTGLNLNNPEFRSNTRVLTGYNAVDGSTDITDSNGHGTHVAGIVGAPGNGSGMYGVAPGAYLLPIKVFSGNSAPSSVVTTGLDYAISHSARVINLSLGATSPTGDVGLRRVAATNNIVTVVAAGNDSTANPNWPSRYAKESWANGTLIAVGSVDANRKMASYSNRAGDIAQFYMVAPGVNIISAYGAGYGYMTGTSMASPAVAGAAALVTGYWPYLRANQVASILLNTADDLGAPGVDAVYGHGMLNVNKALAPIGSYNYKTITGAGTRITLGTSGVTTTQPRVSTPSAFGGLTTEVFDEYGRNFTREEGSAMAGHSVMTVDTILGRVDRMLDTSEKVLADGSSLMRYQSSNGASKTVSQTLNANTSGQTWNHGQSNLASFMAYRSASGYAFSAGDGGLSALTLGLMGTSWGTALSGVDGVLSNPLTGFAPNHRFASVGAPLAGGWSTRVATLQSKSYNAASGDVSLIEVSHQGHHHAFNVSSGDLAEQGLLGGYSNAALGLNQATHTQGITVSGAYLLASQWAVAASWSQTRTAALNASGMLIDATAIHANAFGVGLVRSDVLKAGDRWSMTLNAPLSAQSGKLTYSVVTSVDETGAPQFDTRTVTLKPTAREWTAETRYTRQLQHGAAMSAAVSYRANPDNDSQAAGQLVFGVRYLLSF